MAKQPILYLILIKVNLYLLIIAGCGACNSEIKKKPILTNEKYELVKQYFEERQQFKLTAAIKKIFILSESGCLNCNKSFSDVLVDYINNDSCIILVTAPGNRIDISKFDTKNKNIFYDQNIIDTPYQLLYDSKVLFIKNKKIDTIITIDGSQLDQQFELIKRY